MKCFNKQKCLLHLHNYYLVQVETCDRLYNIKHYVYKCNHCGNNYDYYMDDNYKFKNKSGLITSFKFVKVENKNLDRINKLKNII